MQLQVLVTNEEVAWRISTAIGSRDLWMTATEAEVLPVLAGSVP
jgi:hypothetical protein